MNGMSVLMYHQITPAAPPQFAKYAVTPQAFRWQMSWLRRMGYTSIDLGTLLDNRARSTLLPAHPIIITFDSRRSLDVTTSYKSHVR